MSHANAESKEEQTESQSVIRNVQVKLFTALSCLAVLLRCPLIVRLSDKHLVKWFSVWLPCNR
jgi:hypothetical protein